MKKDFNQKYCKKLLMVVVVFGLHFSIHAQIQYSYDSNGNRIRRDIYVGPPSSNRVYNPSLTHPTAVPNSSDRALFFATKFGIKIYPTVINDILNIQINTASQNNNAQVFLFDINGKPMLNAEVNNPSANQFSLNEMKKGIYLLKVKMQGEEFSYKVVKTY